MRSGEGIPHRAGTMANNAPAVSPDDGKLRADWVTLKAAVEQVLNQLEASVRPAPNAAIEARARDDEIRQRVTPPVPKQYAKALAAGDYAAMRRWGQQHTRDTMHRLAKERSKGKPFANRETGG